MGNTIPPGVQGLPQGLITEDLHWELLRGQFRYLEVESGSNRRIWGSTRPQFGEAAGVSVQEAKQVLLQNVF